MKYLLTAIFILTSTINNIYAADLIENLELIDDKTGLLEQWFEAAESGNFFVLKNIVNKINVNAHDEFGNSALLLASREGHTEIVSFLLYDVKGVKVNDQNPYGDTALMCAATNGHADMVKLLLQVPGIDVNIKNRAGESVLSGFASPGTTGHENIIKMLLDVPGIDINIRNKNGHTIYEFFAKAYPRAEIAQPIKQKLEDLEKQRWEKLTKQAFQAIIDNNLELLKSTAPQIIADTVTNENGDTLLDCAFIYNRTAIIEYLLQNTEDPIEMLARIPFEKVNPTSPIFEYILDIAYAQTSKPYSDIQKVQQTFPCPICGKDALDRCSRCKKIYYCSQECQKTAWKIHKQNCRA